MGRFLAVWIAGVISLLIWIFASVMGLPIVVGAADPNVSTRNVNTYGGVQSAVTAVGAGNASLLINDIQTIRSGNSITFGPNTQLTVTPGSGVSLESGASAYFYGPIVAGPYPIVYGSGDSVFGSKATKGVYFLDWTDEGTGISFSPQNLITNSQFGYWPNSDGPHKMSGASAYMVPNSTGVSVSMTSTPATPFQVGDLITMCGNGSNEEDTGVSCMEISGVTNSQEFWCVTSQPHTLTGVTDIYLAAPGVVSTPNTAVLADWRSSYTTPDFFREQYEQGTTLYNLYSVKMKKGVDTQENLWWPANKSDNKTFLATVAGRTLTFSVEVKTNKANNIRLALHDGSASYSSYHTGSGAWETLSITKSISSSAAVFYAIISADADTGDVAWFAAPRLNYGHVDAGYTPIVNEVVWGDAGVAMYGWEGGTISADTDMNLEALSKGAIPKGVKAVHLELRGICATAGNVLFARAANSVGGIGVQLSIQVNAIGNVRSSGWQPCDSSGDFTLKRTATFTAVYLYANGIQY